MGGNNFFYQTYEELYSSEYQRVHNYVKMTIRSDEMAVEDLTQDVMLVAFEKWDTVREHPNVSGYLLKVARFKIRRWFDKQGRVFLEEDDELACTAHEMEVPGRVDEYKMVDFYASAEKALSSEDVQILRYYYEFGYTASELAKKLGITVANFKIRIVRMKEKLKNSMALTLFLMVGIHAGIKFML